MLKWGIIGCGDVVQRLVQNSLQIENKSKVVNVMSNDITESQLYATKYNITKFTDNADEIIEDPNINCVYIACPPHKHFEYIKRSSLNNKQILCEKPLVTNINDLNTIIRLCNKNKTSLFTAYYRRFLKRFITIKNIIYENNIGDVIFFNIKYIHKPENHPTAPVMSNGTGDIPWRFIYKYSGGGNIIDMGSHAIDMIDFLIGEIVEIQSFPVNNLKLYEVEDTVTVNFKLKDSILGQGMWCSVANQNEDSFEIYGTKGKIKFSMNDNNEVITEINSKIKKMIIPFDVPFHKQMINYVINMFQRNLINNDYTLFENGIRATRIQIKAIENYYS